ncbi:MAG: glycosyltransferase family 2 protein [Flavisolibacter sp.]
MYNEKIEVIKNVINDLSCYNYQIIIVDDGSSYPLKQLLNDPSVTVLTHYFNMGQGAAIQTGIEFALANKADFVITFDGDGQHDAKDAERLLEPLLINKADVTLGSRFLQGSYHNAPLIRRMVFRIAWAVNNLLLGMRLSDTHNGLRGLNRKALQLISITENKMAHATEILLQIKRKKLRYLEIPVHIHYTAYSRKKGQSWVDSLGVFLDLLLYKLFK